MTFTQFITVMNGRNSHHFGGAPDSAWVVSKWEPVVWYEPCAVVPDLFGRLVTPKLPPLRRTCRMGGRA